MELSSDSNDEDVIEPEYENGEDSNFEELDNAAAGEARDYISEVRESLPWAPLCECLTPADVLALRATGSKWYSAKLNGQFAELWFFMKRKGGDEPPCVILLEWASMCLDYR